MNSVGDVGSLSKIKVNQTQELGKDELHGDNHLWNAVRFFDGRAQQCPIFLPADRTGKCARGRSLRHQPDAQRRASIPRQDTGKRQKRGTGRQCSLCYGTPFFLRKMERDAAPHMDETAARFLCSRRAKFAKLRRSKSANSGRLKFANLSQSKRANHKISTAQIGCSGMVSGSMDCSAWWKRSALHAACSSLDACHGSSHHGR